jgi:hypothetical protein
MQDPPERHSALRSAVSRLAPRIVVSSALRLRASTAGAATLLPSYGPSARPAVLVTAGAGLPSAARVICHTVAPSEAHWPTACPATPDTAGTLVETPARWEPWAPDQSSRAEVPKALGDASRARGRCCRGALEYRRAAASPRRSAAPASSPRDPRPRVLPIRVTAASSPRRLLPTTELVIPDLDCAEALSAYPTRCGILGNKQVRLLLGCNALARQSTFWRPGGDNDDASAAVTTKGLDVLTSREDARGERDRCNRTGQR